MIPNLLMHTGHSGNTTIIYIHRYLYLHKLLREDFISIHLKIDIDCGRIHSELQAIRSWMRVNALHQGLTSIHDLHIQSLVKPNILSTLLVSTRLVVAIMGNTQ